MAATTTRRTLPKVKPKTKTQKKRTEAIDDSASSPDLMSQQALRASDFEKKIGITSESLRVIFEQDIEKRPQKIKDLIELIYGRIKDGRRQSLAQWRVYAAIDEAYNAPFHQITPTLIRKILDSDNKMSRDEVVKQFQAWGLTSDTLFTEIENPDFGPRDTRKRVKVVNRETFHKILVPIVRSVLNARESKLFNERNNNPFFVYSPNRRTEEYEVIGNVITQMVETIVTGYGLKSVLRAAIHQALKYSFALMFPCEAWHYEEDKDGTEVYTKKEGLRYEIPHPTRCFWDRNFRPSTLNSDTGCEWAGFWMLKPFSHVEGNPAYWNKDKITFGSHWWGGTGNSAWDVYFEQVYPCIPQHPACMVGQQGLDKNLVTANQTYTSTYRDKGVWLAPIYMKLIPKDWDLGEWEYPIWFRFLMANDDTVIYAEPFPYTPPLFLGSDADDGTSIATASFALEALPWQDMVSNVLSQHLLAVKQNCMKIIPYDKQQVTPEKIREIEARGKESANVIWLPFDAREAKIAQLDTDKMFKPVVFAQTNTTEIIVTITQIFNIMERALGISAQEVGAIAGHIQTAEEIRTVSSNTSARVEYLGTFIDEFIDAWKRQIFEAMQAFMDPDFVVDVNGISPELAKKLKDKFEFELDERDAGFNKPLEVKGKKNRLSVDAFISTREGNTRPNNPQTAAVIMQGVMTVANNELLSSHVDPDDLLKLIDRAMTLAGAPEDAKIKPSAVASMLSDNAKLMAAIQQMTKDIADAASKQATTQAVEATGRQISPALQKLAEGVAQANEGTEQALAGVEDVAAGVAQNTQGDQALAQALGTLVAALQRYGALPPPAPPQMAPPGQPPPGMA